MFVQQFVQPDISKTSKLRITGSLWREYTDYRWIPLKTTNNTKKVFMLLRRHDLNFPSPRCYSFGAYVIYDAATPTCNPGPNIWPLRSGWLTGRPIISGQGI